VAYKNIPAIKKVECEKKVCIKLCDIIHEKPVIIPAKIPKPIVKPKEIIKPKPKPVPKPKPKKIIKPKPKPKPKLKPVVKIVKPKPIFIPKVEEKPVEEIAEEVMVEPTKVVEVVEVVKETEYIKDSATMQKRLQQDYLQKHLAQITKLLQENLYYPRRARRRGIVGDVIVKFKLSTDAQAHSIEIVSSKSDILSRAAVKTIEDLSGEFPKPPEELVLHVPINYELKR